MTKLLAAWPTYDACACGNWQVWVGHGIGAHHGTVERPTEHANRDMHMGGKHANAASKMPRSLFPPGRDAPVLRQESFTILTK